MPQKKEIKYIPIKNAKGIDWDSPLWQNDIEDNEEEQ